MKFRELFASARPLIACIHLLPLPGAPGYGGNMREVYETALDEVEIFKRHGVDGLIVENFRDLPVLVGSGATPDNLHRVCPKVDGLIVGSYFKRAGKGNNLVDEERVRTFAAALASLPEGRQDKKESPGLTPK